MEQDCNTNVHVKEAKECLSSLNCHHVAHRMVTHHMIIASEQEHSLQDTASVSVMLSICNASTRVQ